MDIPVKKLSRLLKPDQSADVRAAAITVLGELGVKDADIAAEILARLDDDSPFVRASAIKSAGKLKLSKALPTLLDRIALGGEEAPLSANAAAQLGAEGVKALQGLMNQVAPGLRRYIAAALTGSLSNGSAAGVAVLLDKDPQVAGAAAAAFMARIPTLTDTAKSNLVADLVAVATDKKKKLPTHAELPVVKVLSALNDGAAAEALWPRVRAPYAPDVRAAALQAVGAWTPTPTKEQWKHLFACAADAEFRVAAPALMILDKLSPPGKQAAEWITLLHAPDVAARRVALEKVGGIDTAEVAAGLMDQLTHPDRALGDAARGKLGGLENGRKALAAALLESGTPEEAWALARPVAPYAKTFSPKLRDDLFARACTFIEAADHRADAILFLLKEADAPGLRDKLVEKGVAKRKKKDYPAALLYLKLLARDPAVGFSVRLELALCGLRQSVKEVAHDSRANDPCLRQFEYLITADAALALTEIEKAKWLEAEDLYYLGFHFAEKFGAEKTFGIGVLKHLVTVSPKSKPAAAAKNKLKSVS